MTLKRHQIALETKVAHAINLPPPRYINFFKPFHFLAGDHLGVPIGESHISLRHKKYNQGIGREEQRTNEQYGLGLTQVQEGDSVPLCIPLCICRLTLASISSKISTKLQEMPTHLDRSSLTAAGLYLMPTGHFSHPVSTPSATLRRPSPTAFSEFLCPTPDSRSLTHFRSRRRSRAQAFVWFRAKTDKGIVWLADHLHSVTLLPMFPFPTALIPMENVWMKLLSL